MGHKSNTPLLQIVVPLFVNHPSLYPIVGKFFYSLKENYPDIPVIVVDDCSPLPHYFPVTIQNKTNLGFTRTINKGLKEAFKKADIVVVLNDDLVIHNGSLDKFFYIKGLTIASVQDSAGTNDDMFGSNFALTREVYELLGGYNEKYRNYFSDRDYYNKAIENGVEIVKYFDIVLEHMESATFKHLDKKKLFSEDHLKFLS